MCDPVGARTEFEDFYNIEGFELKDFFADIRAQLEREIKVSEEQAHFRKAFAFYKDHKGIKVPEIFPFSTEHVTFMEFLNVQKLTDSFVGDTASRRILADRLVTLMTFDALFSKQKTSISMAIRTPATSCGSRMTLAILTNWRCLTGA
jgi:predicted unusual protein kinase regulating ubiquinone biosynthesis (AarF/ABC1/UbiB family)